VRDQNGITTLSVLKVLYLLVVTAVAFMVPAFAITQRAQWFVVPALLALQVIILLACRFPSSEIARPVWRLKWLFLFLIGCYTLLPPESPVAGDLVLPWRVPFVDWLVPLNLTGLERAALMCLQILTLLLASTVVRVTGSGSDLVDGLLAAASNPAAAGHTYFIAHPKPSTWTELGSTAARIMQRRARTLTVPVSLAFAAGFGSEMWARAVGKASIVSREKIVEARCTHWICDTRAAANDLGFNASTSLEAGLAVTLAWYKEAGWIKY